jgi:hypothetical protein
LHWLLLHQLLRCRYVPALLLLLLLLPDINNVAVVVAALWSLS